VGNLKGYKSRVFDLRGSNQNSHGEIQECHGNVCDKSVIRRGSNIGLPSLLNTSSWRNA
jgi:hypothetical protein